MSTQKFLAKHSIIVSSVLILSAILGFLRESSIAYKFGATAVTDAYLCLLTAGLFVVLRQHGIQANPLQGIGKFLVQVIIAVTGMSVLVSEYVHLIGPHFSGKSGLVVVVFSAVVLGAVAYAVFAYVLRIEEVRKGAGFALRKVQEHLLKPEDSL